MLIEMPHLADRNVAAHKPSPGLHALIERAAIVPLAHLGMIRVTGDDRLRWLNGMATNSIQTLNAGNGSYSFFLNAQGRIQGDATAFVLKDSIVLITAKDRTAPLIDLLDRFIIMDDVELGEVEDRVGVLIAGPEAASLLATFGLPARVEAAPHLTSVSWRSCAFDLVSAYSPLVPRFELWGKAADVAEFARALEEAGAAAASDDDLESLRLFEGTPLFGKDIRDKDLPQETAQTRALHFSKGCYLGQEIVERIRSRGKVHRGFEGFVLKGLAPVAGAALFAGELGGTAVGEITSAKRIVLSSGVIIPALGYLRREVKERGQSLVYEGGEATLVSLPYSVLAGDFKSSAQRNPDASDDEASPRLQGSELIDHV